MCAAVIERELKTRGIEFITIDPYVLGRERSLDFWTRIKQELSSDITKKQIEITEARIERMWNIFQNGLPSDEPKREVVFLIQPRDSLDYDFQDIRDHFPACKNIKLDILLDLFRTFPPFEIAKTIIPNGKKDIVGSVVCAPLLIDDMMKIAQGNNRGGLIAARQFAQPIILHAAEFSYEKLGARISGLGETMAGMTGSGRKVQEKLPADAVVTTGHGGTVALIEQSLIEGAGKMGINLSKEKVAIIGCGAIGQATARKIFEKTESLIVYDKSPQAAENLRREIVELGGVVSVARSTYDALSNSNLFVGAVTSVLEDDEIPKRESFGFGIDDSQPPACSRVEFERKNWKVAWPIASAPDGSGRLATIDNSPYSFGPIGLLTEGEGINLSTWGCEMEALTLVCSKEYDAKINGPVTPKEAERIWELAQKTGFKLAPLQSFSLPVEL